MEYSLENVQQTALLSGTGSVIVNIPHPARYALHKLIVAGEREGMFATKSGKDLMQAGLLLDVLREIKPWEVEEAWADLLGRGPGWQSRALRGLAMLEKRFPRPLSANGFNNPGTDTAASVRPSPRLPQQIDALRG